MISVVVLFWLFIILFAIIGAMRGWAKEMLVSFSAILALFFITIFFRYIPFVNQILQESGKLLFWFEMIIFIPLVFFGYQSPNLARLSGQNRFARDRLQDILLGVFIGALNGYLIAGSIWYFMDAAGYPFPNFISAPTGDVLTATNNMMPMMPPELLGVVGTTNTTAIFFAVALAFAFVMVVFI